MRADHAQVHLDDCPYTWATEKCVSVTCEHAWLGMDELHTRQRFVHTTTVRTRQLGRSGAAESPATEPGQPKIWRADQRAAAAAGPGPPELHHSRRRAPIVAEIVSSTPPPRTLAAAPSRTDLSTSL